jgi:O-methyltransferase
MMMRILLKFDECNRKMWAFDSFQGLPPRTEHDGPFGEKAGKGAYGAGEDLFIRHLQVCDAYNTSVLNIRKGWFNETLPAAPIDKIAFLRLDGDLFISTWDGLNSLYHKVTSRAAAHLHIHTQIDFLF